MYDLVRILSTKLLVLQSRFHFANFLSKTETYDVEYRYHVNAPQGWVENKTIDDKPFMDDLKFRYNKFCGIPLLRYRVQSDSQRVVSYKQHIIRKKRANNCDAKLKIKKKGEDCLFLFLLYMYVY